MQILKSNIESAHHSILNLIYLQQFISNFEQLLVDFIEKSEKNYIVKVEENIEIELRNVVLRILTLNKNLFSSKV